MRNVSSLVGESKLSEGDQARKDLIALSSRPLQISHAELDDLARLLSKLEKTEHELQSQSRTEARSQIRADWQAVISRESNHPEVKSADNKNLHLNNLRLISEQRVQLVHNLRFAAERRPGALERLKEILAGYYADQIVNKHHQTFSNQDDCQRQCNLQAQTHTAAGKIRALDLVLVADLDKPGLNTGYLGIDTASKNITPLLAKLLANNNIDRVRADHPLVKPNAEGGYTKAQLQTILIKLQAYSTAK